MSARIINDVELLPGYFSRRRERGSVLGILKAAVKAFNGLCGGFFPLLDEQIRMEPVETALLLL